MSRSHTAVPQMRPKRKCNICCEEREDKIGLQDQDILQLLENKALESSAFSMRNGRHTVCGAWPIGSGRTIEQRKQGFMAERQRGNSSNLLYCGSSNDCYTIFGEISSSYNMLSAFIGSSRWNAR